MVFDYFWQVCGHQITGVGLELVVEPAVHVSGRARKTLLLPGTDRPLARFLLARLVECQRVDKQRHRAVQF
jgi:hypothetical protein